MNIFALDADPVQAAQYANDPHCRKMVLESAQILSTATWLTDCDLAETLYGASKSMRRPIPATLRCNGLQLLAKIGSG
jgi:hypothetical protein